MEWLKVFASLESHLELPMLLAQLNPPFSTQQDDETLLVDHPGIEIMIIKCGAGQYLIRGEVVDIATLHAHVTPFLERVAQSLQMDVFEEDGRLLQRFTVP